MFRSIIVCLCMALSFSLLTPNAHAQETETKVISAPQAKTMIAPARSSEAPPARPSPSGVTDLSAGVVIQASAACCLTQCKGGGNCGNKCKVVDAASQCDLNLVFECPASKGLNCFGGKCTCQ